ncbi:uncharacterized protein EV422DRAFT_540176 [Fimicolochytrium jonesii]|uniref:uncharacterized protein n=1 Tax=Fimicolochytrium jonesii TaxID=1396493 RepID=UPI0022FE2335|nr:uncharacterized protein EV422DRAFT_540176 [Fimicolochytrium jonesii]KAI8817845.1 hypothetical protein EV422DRAFT_540176 [Fimicolochytrium jonesii]
MATVKELALPLSIIAVLLFGILALVIARRKQRFQEDRQDSTEFFLTAKRSIPTFQIAWSFFAGATGSWVVFSLPAYAVTGYGYIGMMWYAFFTGLPLIVIAYVGDAIRNKYPHIMSWGDFARFRYGVVVQIYMTLIVLLNMGINLTAEYTAIGSLFSSIVGVNKLIPILIVGAVTMTYTAVGGLYVSVITDQYQGMFTLLLVVITAIYMAATVHMPNPSPPMTDDLAPNEAGWTSIVTMGVSMTAATFFSDAVWQRVWASVDTRSLRRGATVGALIATFVAFFFGFGGVLAEWLGYYNAAPEDINTCTNCDPNLAFFYLLTKGNTSTDVWIIVLVVILAAVMNESAVDAFQGALTDTVVALASTTHTHKRFGYDHFPLTAARLLVVVINVPIVIVALQGYNINSLYLITNMVTASAVLPMLLGLVRRLEPYIHGRQVLFACLFSLLSIATQGAIVSDGDFGAGIRRNFWEVYDWVAFVVAVVASVVGLFLAAAAEVGLRKVLGRPVKVVRRPATLGEGDVKGQLHEDFSAATL